MSQKFIAREPYRFPNGAIGWRPGGPFDCLGPYAKVENCPIDDSNLRRTCYASGYADTHFSVPANTRLEGKHVSGFFMLGHKAVVFVPYAKHDRLIERAEQRLLIDTIRKAIKGEAR